MSCFFKKNCTSSISPLSKILGSISSISSMVKLLIFSLNCTNSLWSNSSFGTKFSEIHSLSPSGSTEQSISSACSSIIFITRISTSFVSSIAFRSTFPGLFICMRNSLNSSGRGKIYIGTRRNVRHDTSHIT